MPRRTAPGPAGFLCADSSRRLGLESDVELVSCSRAGTGAPTSGNMYCSRSASESPESLTSRKAGSAAAWEIRPRTSDRGQADEGVGASVRPARRRSRWAFRGGSALQRRHLARRGRGPHRTRIPARAFRSATQTGMKEARKRPYTWTRTASANQGPCPLPAPIAARRSRLLKHGPVLNASRRTKHQGSETRTNLVDY